MQRLDRLVTDISNASRLDAELSRDSPRAMDLGRLLADVAHLYQAIAKPGDLVLTMGAGAYLAFAVLVFDRGLRRYASGSRFSTFG